MPLLDDLRKKVDFHQEKAEYHQRELKVYRAALSSAMREAGSEAANLDPKAGDTKTDFVRKTLWAMPNGASPREIRAHGRKKKITVNANFPYTILGKLLEKGDVEKRADGKYILTEAGRDVIQKAL